MTIAVLSWGSPLTLTQSLESYRGFGLDQTDSEKLIYFQEISEQDIDIAHKFGYKWIGSIDNVGIAEGYRRLLEEATGEFFLFLENDWKLIEPAKNQIFTGKVMLNTFGMDIIRYRHRFNPGNPLWTRQFQNRELDSPTHLLDSVYWLDNPAENFPEKIFESTTRGNASRWFYSSSRYANWTNNPHMAYTKFLRENVAPHLGSGDLERTIQSWWEQQDFLVAQGNGLFTHDRTDR